jgi:hypothetical protein
MARNDTWLNRTATIVDPYRRAAVPDDNLLHTADFEGVDPLGREPNPNTQLPTVGPEPDLSALIAADEKLPTQAPAPAVGQGTGSYVEDAAKPATPAEIQEMYATGYPMKDVQAHIKRSGELSQKIIDDGGGMTPSRLVSAAPDWYKQGKPPTSHGGWADAANMLGGVLAAGPNQAMKDPLRPMDLKVQDAKKAAMAGGLSTLLSNLFTHGQTDYKANQEAALKEAQMMKTLPGAKTRAQLEYEANSKYIDQAQRAKMQDSLAGHRNFQEGQVTAELDPNDPQAIAWRASLEAAGIPHEEVKDLGRKALQGTAAAHNITLQAGHTAGQKAADAANTERDIILKADTERNLHLDDELRKEQQRRGESAVPEVEWNNQTPPPPKAVEETRQLYKDKAGFTERIDRMRNIQERLVQVAHKYATDHKLPGGVEQALTMLGPLNQWTKIMPEAHDLVNEAAVLQTSIQNFIRSDSYSNLGVMQKWEDLKTKLMIPMAGSPTAFLRGDATWRALRNDVDKMWVDGVRSYGGHLAGQQDPGAAPGAATPEQRMADRPARALPPRTQYNPRTRQVEPAPEAPVDLAAGAPPAPIPGATPPGPEDAAKIAGAKAQAGAPAPAPAPATMPAAQAAPLKAGQEMYKITKNDKDKTVAQKAMTPEQAAILKSHTDVIASVEEM